MDVYYLKNLTEEMQAMDNFQTNCTLAAAYHFTCTIAAANRLDL